MNATENDITWITGIYKITSKSIRVLLVSDASVSRKSRGLRLILINQGVHNNEQFTSDFMD